MAIKSTALRDAVVLVVVFGVLLGGLYAYTGSWPPAVIVESGSMMHADSEVTYGRFGTIDPGDLVLVKDIDSVDDIVTQVDGGRDHYGKAGDVVIYYPGNNRARTPIIHRAVAYVELEGSQASPTFYVRWSSDDPCEGGATKIERNGRSWCQYGSDGIYVRSVPIQGHGSTPSDPNPYRPTKSGFITKGDNPVTNTQTDQLSGLSHDGSGGSVPVQLEWIEGVGRAELPWLGLIKLALAGRPNELNPPAAWSKVGSAYAPKDLWVMLGITLFLIVGVPLLYDGYKAIESRRAAKALPSAPGVLNAQVTTRGSVHLSWDHVGGPIHAYRVYRGGERIASTPGTEHEDAAPPTGASHSYSVSAVNEFGNEGPRSPAAIVQVPPAETP